MENFPKPKQQTIRCVNCNQPLTTFMAYILGRGDSCLKCFSEYAQAHEDL